MKKILFVLLFTIVFSFRSKLVWRRKTKFTNDTEAQESVDFTICSKIIKKENYLELIKQLIQEGDFPKDSDLEKTALSVCLQMSKTKKFRNSSQRLVKKAREGKAKLYVPVRKDIFKPSPILPPVEDLDVNLEAVKEKVKRVLTKVKKLVDDVVDDVIDIIDEF